MPDKQKGVDLEITSETVCNDCGQTSCDHQSGTQDLTGEAERRRRRKARAEELPPELAEFAATYEVQGLIGEGGMSAVYKAQHRALNKPMAIKMLHAHLVRDVVQRKRFEQEAQALFLLEHPNIVKLRDFGSTTNQKPFLVMDFLQGSSLSEVLKEGPIPVARAMQLFLQCCNALEHAHDKAIIHRDIKPSNIVLVKDEHGRDSVRIVDFGIAKFNQDEINAGLTQTGDVFGSPLYMSPEQCLGHKLDPRSDIYALGCVMYETLSGRPPLVGESALSTIHKHTSEMPKPLQVPDCDAKLRERLDEIIFKTLEKDPDKRYQSMSALRNAIQELLEDTGYRKGAGFYVRYARFHRNAINAVKRNPIRFVAALAIAVAAISFITLKVATLTSSVAKDPVTLNNQIGYVWLNLPIERQPVRYNDVLRKARFVCDQSQQILGEKHVSTMNKYQKFSQYLMKYGDWDEAILNLQHARAGLVANYGADDPNVPDTDATIGDCYLQKGRFAEARDYYAQALQGFGRDTADNIEDITRLKYAVCLLKTMNVTDAKLLFERELHSARPFEKLMANQGIADCDLATIEAGVTPEERQKLITDARRRYESVKMDWRQYSKHDAMVAWLRLADTYLLDGNWELARNMYEHVLKEPNLFTESDLAKIKSNYARLLWRTMRFPEAIAMDEQATHAARAASQLENEQNTMRFVPIRER